jgi:hypothetical protein
MGAMTKLALFFAGLLLGLMLGRLYRIQDNDTVHLTPLPPFADDGNF